MLNRNGTFGNRDDKLNDQGKMPGTASYRTGAAGTGSSAQADLGVVVVTTPPRVLRDANVAAKLDEARGSKLMVGPNIKLKGVEISDCDMLVVEGHVEGTLDSRAVQITASGTLAGTACVDVADIHGEFTGELLVRKKLVIHATGKVSGKVRYGKLVIEEGGEMSGEIKTLAQAGEPPVLATVKGTPVQAGMHH